MILSSSWLWGPFPSHSAQDILSRRADVEHFVNKKTLEHGFFLPTDTLSHSHFSTSDYISWISVCLIHMISLENFICCSINEKKKTHSIFSNINSKTFVQYKSIYNKNTPPSLLSLPHKNHHKIHSNAPQTLYLRWNYSFVSVKSIRKVKLTPTNCCVAVDRIYWSVKPEVWCRRCFSSMTRFLPDCWRH